MNETWEFWLHYRSVSDVDKSSPSGGQIGCFETFVKVCKLLGKPQMSEVAKRECSDYTKLQGDPASLQMKEALSLLKECGLHPVFTLAVPSNMVASRLPIRRLRETTGAQIDSCEYLRLAFCEARIGYHYSTKGDAIIALGEKEEFKRTADIGDLAPGHRLAVSAKFMSRFQVDGLKGALFLPIEWRPRSGMAYVPDEPIRTHWLSAEKEMPRCQTPRIGFSGELTGVHFWDNQELITYSIPHMECGWDDEGRTDFTLRFHRRDVEAMGDFDIACTYEWIHLVGDENPRWFPQLIVSQRFRHWAKKQRYKLHYGLCELVE